MTITDFAKWLNERLDPGEGEAAAFLKNLVGSGRLDSAADLAAGRAMLEQEAPAALRDDVLASFDAGARRYRAEGAAPAQKPEGAAPHPQSAMPPGLLGWFVARATLSGIVTGVIGIGMLIATFWFLSSDGSLRSLADVHIARGLITFLFAIGTIGIAILMICALFLSSQPDLAQRYDKAKEILTTLIAVLGTIVGFYFGSQRSDDAPLVPLIGTPVIDPQPAAAGSVVRFIGLANGGALPFSYAIDLHSDDAEVDATLQDVVEGTTDSGLIVQSLAIPAEAAGKTILIDLSVTDADGRTATLDGTEVQVAATRPQ